MSPRVLVVQHDLDDPLFELAAPLLDAGLDLWTWCVFSDDPAPTSLDGFDGVVSLGALSGVADDHGWTRAERALLEEALDRGLPVLGVCFGAQLLAAAAGGTPRPGAATEVGWCPVALEPPAYDDPLLHGVAETFLAYQYHYDTFDLPGSATVLARNGEVVEAFRVGERAWGLQFHVEATPATVLGWAGTYRALMAADGIDEAEMLAETRRQWRSYRELTWKVGERWAAQVLDAAGRAQA